MRRVLAGLGVVAAFVFMLWSCVADGQVGPAPAKDDKTYGAALVACGTYAEVVLGGADDDMDAEEVAIRLTSGFEAAAQAAAGDSQYEALAEGYEDLMNGLSQADNSQSKSGLTAIREECDEIMEED